MKLNKEIQAKLAYYHQHSLIRQRSTIEHQTDTELYITNKKYLNFCSNDYLGMRGDSQIQAAIVANASLGLGSGGSPLITGYHTAHEELEAQFAEFLKRDSAILYGSGYLANIGVITTFANKNSTVLLDKLCHASLIDATLLANTTYHRYPHNDIKYLQKYLQQHVATDKPANNTYIVTEGVFGMEGNTANLTEIVNIAKEHANIILDDTHGMGVLGQNAAGICDQYNLTQTDVPLLITSLAMAFGSYGAIVAGSKATIEILKQFSRTYLYATTLPPLIPAITSQILKRLQRETWRREKLQENSHYLHVELAKLNIQVISNQEIPIKIIMVKDNLNCIQLQQQLKENGILVAAIRPPTVPPGTARLKLTVNALHTKADIDQFIAILAKYL